jgi:hypothetical protein
MENHLQKSTHYKVKFMNVRILLKLQKFLQLQL